MTLTTLTAQLENRDNAARTDVVRHGIGLLPGELGPADLGVTELKAVGATATQERVQWRPFGRRYIDGSFKYIEASYRADLTSGQEKQVTISAGTSTTLNAFALSAAATTGVAAGSISFQVNGITRTLTLASIVQPGNVVIDPGVNGCKARYRVTGRLETVPTTQAYAVAFEVTLDLYSGVDYANVYVKYGYGLASSTVLVNGGNAWNNRFLNVTTAATIATTNVACYMMWEAQRFHAVSHVGPHVFTIHDPNMVGGVLREKWPFGLLYRRKGRIFFGATPAGTKKEFDTRGMAMDWSSKNSSPYGLVAAYPGYVSGRTNAIVRIKAFRDTYEAAGQTADPLGSSGLYNQYRSDGTGEAGVLGFGSNHGQVMLRAGHPGMLEVMEREAYQDSLRLSDYLDENGIPWEHTAHPEVNIDHGRPIEAAADQFGINLPVLSVSTEAPRAFGIGDPWTGLDTAHWATVAQMQAALCGCDYLLLDEFDNMYRQQVIASTYTDKFFNSFTPISNSARDFGRGQALAHVTVYEVTGDAGVLDSLRSRIRVNMEGIGQLDRRYYGCPADRRGIGFPLQSFPMTASAFGAWQRQGPALMLSSPPGNGTAFRPDKDTDSMWTSAPATAGAWAASLLFAERQESVPRDEARYMAVDLAGWIVSQGFLVSNRGDVYRDRMLHLPKAQVLPGDGLATDGSFTALETYNRANFVGTVVTGQTSGATGTCVIVTYEFEGSPKGYGCWLKDCSAVNFLNGETVSFGSSGITAVINNQRSPLLGCFSIWVKPDASFLTRAEMEETVVTDRYGGNYQGITLVTRNIYWYLPKAIEQAVCVAIAWHYARNGFYATANGDRNAEIEARARLLMDTLRADSNSYTGATWDTLDNYMAVVPLPTVAGTPPGRPVIQPMTNITAASFVMNWARNGTNEDGFRTQYRVVGAMSWTVGPPASGGQLSVPVTGLVANTLYEAQVQAFNGNGDSDWSDSAQATTLPVVGPIPGAPTDPSTTNITESSFLAQWVQADNLVEVFQTEYRIVGAGSFTTGPTQTPMFMGNMVSVVIGGLVADTNYEFHVRAHNGNGNSAYSSVATAHTLAIAGSAPGAPTDPVVANVTTTSLTYGWTPADTTEDEFEVSVENQDTMVIVLVPVARGVYFTVIDGLDPDTEYEVKVLARNGNGDSAYSGSSFVTTLADVIDPPSAPDSPQIVRIAQVSFVFRWRITSTTQTAILVRYKKTADMLWTTLDPLMPNETSVGINNLVSNTEYEAQAAARNSGGDSAWSSSATATTLAIPNQPVLNPATFGDLFDDFL